MLQPSKKLILASRSPRRRQLLSEAGYQFQVIPAADSAECGLCSGESPPEMVARLAYQKAKDVAISCDFALVLGCDTVAECCGQILGKPNNEEHAREMLTMLHGRVHHVYSGVCLWSRPQDDILVKVDVTKLEMDAITDSQLEAYLATDAWQDKAGAFGYQDGLDWVHIIAGSESNVVGLPLELLEEMIVEVEKS